MAVKEQQESNLLRLFTGTHSYGFLIGLVLIFFGERILAPYFEGGRWLFTGPGIAAAIGFSTWRLMLFTKARGQKRQVELLTLMCYVVGLIALLGYALTTDWGVNLFGLSDASDKTIERFVVPMTVLWTVMMTVSLIPLIMMEASEAFQGTLTGEAAEGSVESARVRQIGISGLTIGLALSLLMVTCQIGADRNIRKDLGYFKTSTPGAATVNIVASFGEPMKVILFFEPVNQVKEEVLSYFKELDSASGGKLEIEVHEQSERRSLSEEYKVSKNGTIVFVKGDKHETFTVETEIDKAQRKQLRTLDGTVHKTLLKVNRAKRIAYMTIGHGELNDPDSAGAGREGPPRPKAAIFKTKLQDLNYEVKEINNFDLNGSVPDDATMVIALSPLVPFSDAELQSLDEYLGNGGALFLALDPSGDADVGLLESRLGVAFESTRLADDKSNIHSRPPRKADRAVLVTNQFSSHGSITTLGKAGARIGIPLISPGSLVDVEFKKDGGDPKRTYVVRTMNSAFADANENLEFDEGETRQRFNVVAAIEDKKALKASAGDEAQPRLGMRAMVFANSAIFSDRLLDPRVPAPLLKNLVEDSLKWLGGEEKFSGDITSEEDVKIEHTAKEDSMWFWLTIVGFPLLILILGLLWVRMNRRSTQGRA